MNNQETQSASRDALIEKLCQHFGMNGADGTYWHVLTRDKSARHVGTLTIDDFTEIDTDLVAEIADVFLEAPAPEPTTDDVEDLARELYDGFNNNTGDAGKYDSPASSDFFREPFRTAARKLLAKYSLTPRKTS